jgi:hypothetical protein
MLLIRLACAKISRHLVDMTQLHDFSDDLICFLDTDEVIFRVLFRERSASDDDSNVNKIEEKTSWCNSVKYSSFRRVSERLTTFFISASNIIAISLRTDEKSDRDDCVTNRNSELIDDDDSDDDDEARSREKSTEIVFWFFFFSIEDNTIQEKKTAKITSRFFFSSFKVRILEKKRTTKVIFRFFFSFKRATNDDDMMTMIFIWRKS